MLSAIMAVVVIAMLVLYWYTRLPAAGLIVVSILLLIFGAMPEHVRAGIVMLCVGWAWARACTVDYHRMMEIHYDWKGRFARPRDAVARGEIRRVTLKRSSAIALGHVCAGMVAVYLGIGSRETGFVFGIVGVEVMAAHIVYFGARDEPLSGMTEKVGGA